MPPRRTGGRALATIFLVLSALAAVIAVLVVWMLVQSYQQQLQAYEEPEPTRPVVVAAETLFPGGTIHEEQLIVKDIPPDYVPETVFSSVEDIVGRVPTQRVIAGEPVREERLADRDAGIGLNALIPPGYRARSINITDASSVSGFLNPGNYVDVLVTLRPEGRRGRRNVDATRTRTLLQAVEVLAVDNRMGSGEVAGGGRPSVTLALTPEQVEKLTHAHIEGAVVLTLRNDVDVTETETHGARSTQLIGRADTSPVEVEQIPPAPAPTTTPDDLYIFRGGRMERRTMDGDGNVRRRGR